MQGKVLQVNVSPGGIPKRAIAKGQVSLTGIAGDSWANLKYHGGPDQALLVIASETLARLREKGFPVFAGALGENLTTEGLDVRQWRVGQTFRAGSVRLQFTKTRVPCRKIQVYGASIGQAIFDVQVKAGDFTSPVWGFSGMYARVVTPGVVQPGDLMELESEFA